MMQIVLVYLRYINYVDVGRSEHQSYCVLIASPKTETGIERMKIMTQTTDGFELSERDLEMRGPGRFLWSQTKWTTRLPRGKRSRRLPHVRSSKRRSSRTHTIRTILPTTLHTTQKLHPKQPPTHQF